MSKNFSIPLHTILMTVAPSGSGKSFYCKNNLLPYLKDKYPDYKINYLSSDDIRRELLCDENRHKYDKEMLEVSDQAFSLLYKRIELSSSYPINSELIVVDTTGLSPTFRNDVIQIARKNNYNTGLLLFDYKNYDDYFLYNNDLSFDHKSIIHKHLKRFKREVLPNVKKERHAFIHRITDNNFDDFVIDFDSVQVDTYQNCNTLDKDLFVIGDVHGCYNELLSLLERRGYKLSDDRKHIVHNPELDYDYPLITLVGDYLDKGNQIKEVIEFIYDNLSHFKIVIGNHENYIFKKFTNQLTDTNSDVEDKHFSSIKILENNSVLLEKFIHIFNLSVPFIKSKNGYVTHAPCEQKYIGKLDNYSTKKQRNLMYSRQTDELNDEDYINLLKKDLGHLEKEAIFNGKLHIFGHVGTRNVFTYGNKIGIDTGCVSGNELTGVSLFNDMVKPLFYSVKTEIPFDEKLINLNRLIKRKVTQNYDDLSFKEKARIDWIIKNKINFISGTMSPSDKDIDNGVLENIDSALTYYRDNGIEKVIIQPKYMGSYCNMYIFNDLEKCYAVSRNGYLIKQPIPESVYVNLQKHLTHDVECMIFAGELLPWRVLGSGLIDGHYDVIKTGIETEYNELVASGFFEQFNLLKDGIVNSPNHNDIIKQFNSVNKNKLNKELGGLTYENYKSYFLYQNMSIDKETYLDNLNVFKEQLDIFGTDVETTYKPFAILKTVYKDGREESILNSSNIDMFSRINDDDYAVIDITNENDWITANEYYNNITTNQKMEGVVIKPEFVDNINIAQFIKVRNEKYLSLIYGYDYKNENKYNRLINRKSINKKLRLSIDEFKLGVKMLSMPYNTIEDNNIEYKNLIVKFLKEEVKEKQIDPRL